MIDVSAAENRFIEMRQIFICQRVAVLLRHIKEERAWTEKELAVHLRISRSHVSHLLSGVPSRSGHTPFISIDEFLTRFDRSIAEVIPTATENARIALLALTQQVILNSHSLGNEAELLAHIDVSIRFSARSTVLQSFATTGSRQSEMINRISLSILTLFKSKSRQQWIVVLAARYIFQPLDSILDSTGPDSGNSASSLTYEAQRSQQGGRTTFFEWIYSDSTHLAAATAFLANEWATILNTVRLRRDSAVVFSSSH